MIRNHYQQILIDINEHSTSSNALLRNQYTTAAKITSCSQQSEVFFEFNILPSQQKAPPKIVIRTPEIASDCAHVSS